MAKNDDPRASEVRARLDARNKSVEEYYASLEGLQPTPTQEENDLAKVGLLDSDAEKQDDGSEWQDDHTRRIMSARIPGENPYDTRALEAGSASAEGQQRRRGRPARNTEE